MKKIMLIVPYFGIMPSYYKVWEMSAKRNSTIDFLIITDDTSIIEKDNIKVTHMKFEDLKKRVQKLFDFDICLEKPYKLCDYKPAYGLIFAEELKGYDFWGHCDIDLIFGDIRHFVTDQILEENDKVYEHGHFCLYRNMPQFTQIVKNNGPYPEFNYKEVYSSNDAFGFDEFHGMVCKCHRLNLQMYLNTNDFFDCKTDDLYFKDAFHVSKKIRTIIKYEDGKLYTKEITEHEAKKKNFSKIKTREIMYFHFQKRTLNGLNEITELPKHFWIIPNKFIWDNCSYQKLYKTKNQFLYHNIFKIKKNKKKLKDHRDRFLCRKKAMGKYTILDYVKERKDCQKRFQENAIYIKRVRKNADINI